MTAFALTAVAIVLGRLTPDPAAVRTSASERYLAINGPFFERGNTRTEVLDAETGQLLDLDLPEGEMLQWASFSEWTDARGERQVVGRWSKKTGSYGSAVCEGVGLGRFAFPSGRALDQIATTTLPTGTPCWYPGTAARVLFAGADGRLYQYAFEQADGTAIPPSPDGVLPVEWPNRPTEFREVSFFDPYWPKDPRLGGRFLASVSVATENNGRRTLEPCRLWWVQLTSDGASIADAGPLSTESPYTDSPDGTPLEERLPRVARAADGGLALAYQVRPAGSSSGRLRVARLEFDARTRAPIMTPAHSEELAADCKAVPPVFTPRGDGLYAFHWRHADEPMLRRYTVDGVLSRLASARGPERPHGPLSFGGIRAASLRLLLIGVWGL